MDKNGNLYFGLDTLYSVDYEGRLRWKYNFNNANFITSDISIDGNNNIYFTISDGGSDRKLISLNKDGKLLWEVPLPRSHPAVNYSIGISYNYLISPSYRSDSFYLIK